MKDTRRDFRAKNSLNFNPASEGQAIQPLRNPVLIKNLLLLELDGTDAVFTEYEVQVVFARRICSCFH